MADIDETLAAGVEHHRAGRLHEAEQAYRRVLAVDPRNSDAVHLLGLVALHAGQPEAARTRIGQAIAIDASVPAYHNNLGEALRRLGRFDEAREAYRRAIALDPDFAEAHNNLGTVHELVGRTDEALACYERAVACRADYVNARYNRARAWLAVGDFARGWPEYEWRWRRAEFTRPALAEGEWDGTPLDGRGLLARWEQGLGDTLQFVRFVRLLQSAGERVSVTVQAELVELLRQSGLKNVFGPDEPLPEFDVHAMLFSLPYRLGTTLETIPAEVPYIAVEADRAARWRARLAALPQRFKIGICWQGNPRSPFEPYRSIPLAEFAPLAAVDGVQLVSLQKGVGREQIAALAEPFELVDWADELDPGGPAMVDAAALVAGVDLVITSDTAIAHLAGAMGRPVWVALPVSADARWLVGRSDSPWYPTMWLFRQGRLGVWRDVFTEMRAALVD